MTAGMGAHDGRNFTSGKALGLSIHGLEKKYTTGKHVLSDINIKIKPGESVSILGPSGCGKSSLLRLIAGLSRPSQGRIEWLDGERKTHPHIGLVPQEPTLMPWRTVFENVYMPLQLAGQSRNACRVEIMRTLEAVDIASVANAYPHQLSGGMRMRVSIARALVCQPNALLMDEPFAALDEVTRGKLNNDLVELQTTSGITMIFVTHSISEAVYLSSRVIVLKANPGQIHAEVPIASCGIQGDGKRSSEIYAQECNHVSKLLKEASFAS